MTEETNNLHLGGCRCGQVRFQAKGEPIVTMACHCTGCQQMTASAFSLSSLYPANCFEIVSGEPVIGGTHGLDRHYFCPHCMSWLFTRPNGFDEIINVRATLLDDASSYEPFIETYIGEKLPWAKTPAKYSFDKFPPMEQFPVLMAEFAKQSA